MKTRVILVRHAVTDANVSNLFLGRTDVNLSDTGLKQAKALSRRLSKEIKIDVIYSSNMKRTLQTAYYVASQHGVPVFISDKLKEINFGDWEGKSHEEVAFKYPYEFLKWLREQKLLSTVHGESLQSFQRRLVGEVKRIVKANRGKNVVLVSHGACIKALLCYFKGYSLDMISEIPWCDNTALNVIEFDEDSCDIVSMADSAHLTLELKPSSYSDLGLLVESAENLLGQRKYKLNRNNSIYKNLLARN